MGLDLSHPPLARLLAASDQLYLAVSASTGPLVTPELFTEAEGKLWCLTARKTAKARLLSDGDRVTVMVRDELAWAVIGGVVERFDAADPRSLAPKISNFADAGRGLARFLHRNSYEMAGAAVAAAAGRLGVPPAARMLMAIEPMWAIGTDIGGEGVVEAGEIPSGAARHAPADPQPGEVEAPELEDQPVALGWMSTWGALALPAIWRAGDGVALVDRALFARVAGERSSRAAVSVDTWSAPGPLGKQGTMFRGTGWVQDGDAAAGGAPDDQVRIVLDTERIVSWDGIDVSAVDV